MFPSKVQFITTVGATGLPHKELCRASTHVAKTLLVATTACLVVQQLALFAFFSEVVAKRRLLPPSI
jgi:hypothetical protein